MAVPKRRWSKARTRRHKSLWKLSQPGMVKCECGEFRMPHRICPNCGKYDKKTVINVEEQ